MTNFKKSTVREYFESIVIAVILALFIRTWVVQAFKIPTGSMEENLLIGDHLLVNKFAYAPTVSSIEQAVLPVREVHRGDIVVFKYPEEPERDFIKRVIGLPGETLEIRRGQVHIDGAPIEEPYLSEDEVVLHGAVDDQPEFGPISVPEGHYFVLGDNRDNSQDSRYWGPLPANYVKGRAVVIYWSYDAESGYAAVETGVGATLRRIGSVVGHFFTRTRWGRLFMQTR